VLLLLVVLQLLTLLLMPSTPFSWRILSVAADIVVVTFFAARRSVLEASFGLWCERRV